MRFNYELKTTTLRPDITPLIDVIFLLLIFFMLGSQFVYTTNIQVDLPTAETGKVTKQNPITITINKNSELFIENTLITFKKLNTIFREMKKGTVSIVADKDTPFGAVIKVWDYARKYKLSQIEIKTERGV